MTTPFTPGQILIDKYQVEKVIGEGGMGVVVAALHVQLRRRVAIKFLLPEMLRNPEVVARFLREARAAAMLETEHVAKVIDVGSLPDGVPFMVMELLSGMDLASLAAQRGPLSVQEAVTHILQACEAIAEAHRAGIVHRDLKPSNLFLASRADGSSTVKVLDFGISKLQSTTASVALTSDAAVMGSPTYMAPEQIKCAKAVDTRADIWGLGVVLYELLAGKPPFSGTEFHEVLAKVLLEPPAPLSTCRSDIPKLLDATVLRCLEKEPAKRFPSVTELAHSLSPFAVGDDARMSIDRISRLARPAAADGAEAEVLFLHPPSPAESNTNIAVAATSPAVPAAASAARHRIILVGATTAAVVLALVVGGVALSRFSASAPGTATALAIAGASDAPRASDAGTQPSEPHSDPSGLALVAAPSASSADVPREPMATSPEAATAPRTTEARPPTRERAPPERSENKRQSKTDPTLMSTPPETPPAPAATTSKKSPLDVGIK